MSKPTARFGALALTLSLALLGHPATAKSSSDALHGSAKGPLSETSLPVQEVGANLLPGWPSGPIPEEASRRIHPSIEDKAFGLDMEGGVDASLVSNSVRMRVDRIVNDRSSGVSGTLRLELWATAERPVFGETIFAHTLGTFSLGTLQAGFQIQNVDSGFVAYTPPPAGCYYLTVALMEFDSGGYSYVDLRTLQTGGTPDGSGYHRFSFGGVSCAGSSPCIRDAFTACLQNGRFEAKVSWTTDTNNGSGQIMSFGGQRAEGAESAFYWFFASTNFEMGLKVLNACGLNNRYWVFISGLTDQGWTLRIRDTQTGATKIYSNPRGRLTPTTADTSALSCP